MAVSVPVANVRSGPDESADLLWKVERYHPVRVIEKKGDWCRFQDFENDEGWLYLPLLDTVRAVITRKDDCNIRSGPATTFDIVFTAEKGIPFKVLTDKGKWLEIQHADGDKGWIYRSLVWPEK